MYNVSILFDVLVCGTCPRYSASRAGGREIAAAHVEWKLMKVLTFLLGCR